jgi:hypothetical protein
MTDASNSLDVEIAAARHPTQHFRSGVFAGREGGAKGA